MGISPFKNSSAYIPEQKVIYERNPNPNPKNYKIVRFLSTNHFLVIEVLYPDCVNFEGRKILVFEDIGLRELDRQGWIDPHFCDNENYHYPIARFEPTERGWDMAGDFILCQMKKK